MSHSAIENGTNTEQLRELATGSKTFYEFYVKATEGVLRVMTIAEYKVEMNLHGTSNLEDYFEKIKGAE